MYFYLQLVVVVQCDRLCCAGFSFLALLEFDCLVFVIYLTRSDEDPVLELVLDLQLRWIRYWIQQPELLRHK